MRSALPTMATSGSPDFSLSEVSTSCGLSFASGCTFLRKSAAAHWPSLIRWPFNSGSMPFDCMKAL